MTVIGSDYRMFRIFEGLKEPKHLESLTYEGAQIYKGFLQKFNVKIMEIKDIYVFRVLNLLNGPGDLKLFKEGVLNGFDYLRVTDPRMKPLTQVEKFIVAH